MSGATAACCSGGGLNPVNPLTPMTLSCLGLIGSTHIGSISFLNDGTVTKTVSAPNGGTSVLTNWFLPTTTGIGSSYWIKFTLSSGSAWDAGIVSGAVTALSSTCLVQWSAATGTNKIASVAVAIYADAGGTALVASGTLSVDIESSN